MNKKKELIIAVLGIVSVLVLAIGVTYSFLRYTKKGSTDNTITTGTIKFLYTETSLGRGIELKDAMPVSDEVGKNQTGSGKVFDFKITADTMKNTSIPYTVTVRKETVENSLAEKDVKLYITEVNSNIEENGVIGKFNDDSIFPKYKESNIERIIYKGTVPSETSDYIQNLRLRMWIDEKADFSPLKDEVTGEYIIENGEYKYPNNNKTFKVKVNVYATGGVLTPDQVNLEKSADTLSVEANNKPLTATDEEEVGYRYETELENVETANIKVITESNDTKVKIEKIATPDINAPSIQNMSYTKNLKLTIGENYFRITVTSLNKKTTDKYIIKIKLKMDGIVKNVDSILEGLSDETLTSGYYIFKINGKEESYPIHLYVLNGNQTFTESRKFGDLDDASVDENGVRQEAKRMVAVKVNGDLTINENVTIEPNYDETTGYGGPKGFTLYVTGTLTNNGTIDNSHGAYATGEDVYLWKNSDGTYEYVPAQGGAGGMSLGEFGKSGINRQTGGGGVGGYYYEPGYGGNGSSYSGGAGGGGGGSDKGGDGSSIGGAGGNGTNSSGGGAGNPGGIGKGTGVNGTNGTGGLLVIYTQNYINNGLVSAEGKSGGLSTWRSGGSSGGGSINIFYTNNKIEGTVNINGGSAVGDGAAGGNGTVTYKNIVLIKSISSNSYNTSFIDGEYNLILPEYRSSIPLTIQLINNTDTVEVTSIDGNQKYNIDNIPLKNGENSFKIKIKDSRQNQKAEYPLKISIESGSSHDFKYQTGSIKEQILSVAKSGTYKLEVWGAQGGSVGSNPGGYGTYSVGQINLNKNDVLYINIGGQGMDGISMTEDYLGGYNGGGNSYHWGNNDLLSGSGGGATHIAKVSGELSTLSAYKGELSSNEKYYISNKIIIVSGGGGGSVMNPARSQFTLGGSAGGIKGSNGTPSPDRAGFYGLGGTQTSGGLYTHSGGNYRLEPEAGTFGKGGDSTPTGRESGGGAGAGSGFFGGGGATVLSAAGGGSSYIANPNLTNKAMYCFNCVESTETETKTISTTGSNSEVDKVNCPDGYSSSPISKCAKAGNGYARITYLGE